MMNVFDAHACQETVRTQQNIEKKIFRNDRQFNIRASEEIVSIDEEACTKNVTALAASRGCRSTTCFYAVGLA